MQTRGFLAAIWAGIVIFGAYRCFQPILHDPPECIPMEEEAVRMGFALYKYGAYLNPYKTFDTGPTAHTAPGFPTLVAGLYHVFGDQVAGAYAVQMTEATAVVAQIALLPFVMEALGSSFLTGLLGSLFAVIGVRRDPTWEANYSGLLLMAATLLACRYYRAILGKTDPSALLGSPLRIASVFGLVWGAILLTGPSAGSIWVVWLALGIWVSRRFWSPRAWIPALILPLLLLIPWEWRNYNVFHAVVPIRDTFGLEFQLSNNPCAKVTLWQSRHGEKCYDHPNEVASEAQRVVDLGEVVYNRGKLREAVSWIASHPAQALSLWRKRFVVFWFLPLDRRIATWAMDFATVLSPLGLLVLYRRSRLGAFLCGTILLAFPAVYYTVLASDRYRLPIMWVTFGLAAAGCAAPLEWAFGSLRFRRGEPSIPASRQ